MAILALISAEGVTKDIYESLRKVVNWEHNQPPGSIFHVASFGSGNQGIRVVDIWASEQDFNNFVNTRLAPALQKLNVPTPNAEIFQVHNINIFPTAEK